MAVGEQWQSLVKLSADEQRRPERRRDVKTSSADINSRFSTFETFEDRDPRFQDRAWSMKTSRGDRRIELFGNEKKRWNSRTRRRKRPWARNGAPIGARARRAGPVRRCVFNYSIIHPAIHHQPSVKFILFLCIGPLQLATMYQLLISHDLFGARGILSAPTAARRAPPRQ